MGIIDELEKLQKLKENGVITAEEFELGKKKILNSENEQLEDKDNNKQIGVGEIEETNSNKIEKSIYEKDKMGLTEANKEVKQSVIPKKMFCSKCGNELYENEKFCGKCGQSTNETVATERKVVQNKKNKERIVLRLISIIAVVLLVGLVIVNYSNNRTKTNTSRKTNTINTNVSDGSNTNTSNTPNNTNTASETKTSTPKKSRPSNDTITACAKTLVSNTLRSSSTAIWGTSEVVDEDDYGRYLVYVALEAQNGFGGYSKLNYFIILQTVETDGTFTYKPYVYSYAISSYVSTPYQYVTEYKSGKIVPVIQTFLDNNNWNNPQTNTTTN